MAQNTWFSVNEAKFLKTGLQQAGEKFLNKDFYLWNGYPEILVMTTRWLSVPWASVSTHKLMTALDKTRPDETREFLLGYTGRESLQSSALSLVSLLAGMFLTILVRPRPALMGISKLDRKSQGEIFNMSHAA